MEKRHELTLELENAFRQVFRKLKKEIDELLGEHLTSTEFIYLKHLSQKGRQMVSALSQEFDCTVSHVTAVTDRLVKKELVKRQRSETDRRVVELVITPKGKDMVTLIENKKKDYFMQKFEELSTEEMETLLRLFQKLA